MCSAMSTSARSVSRKRRHVTAIATNAMNAGVTSSHHVSRSNGPTADQPTTAATTTKSRTGRDFDIAARDELAQK